MTQALIKTGVLDRSTLKLFQHWNLLPSGAETLSPEDDNGKLKAGRSELIKLADTIGDAYDKERNRRETYLDLSRLRWPVKVVVHRPDRLGMRLDALTDHLGRFYFQVSSARKEWFVPGIKIDREVLDLAAEDGTVTYSHEEVFQATTLSIGETPVCIQVTTLKMGE